MNKSKILLSLFLLSSLFTFNGCTLGPVFGGDIPIEPKGIIYEEDDRQDFFEIYDISIQNQAKASPALIKESNLEKKEDGSYRILPYKNADGSFLTYAKRFNFDEVTNEFADQPMAASCSGFLVAPDIVVTAGHCVHDKTDEELSKIKLVFGYWMESSTEPVLDLPKENIYSIKKVIHSKHNSFNNVDYAVIQLDRECTVAKPLRVSKNNVKNGDYVYIIGYPNGLPLKYSPNAHVFRISENSFLASLDAFKGNSGSAVFNANGEVVGVYMETYLILIGVDYYGRLKPHGPSRIDLYGNRSTHVEKWINYIPE